MNRQEKRAQSRAKSKPETYQPTPLQTHPRTDVKRILWVSNAPWAPTGYGQQSNQAVRRLARDKHEVAIMANYGLEAANTTWDADGTPVPVYPRGNDTWSNDVIPAHAHHWTQQKPELQPLIITLFDVWVFKGPRWADWPVWSWVPVDHVPAPVDVAGWCRMPFVKPISMSLFGKAMLENVNIESEYAPHGIEATYKPTPTFTTFEGEQMSGRALMEIPEDRFVVSMVANNKGVYPTRKAFGENLLAFSIFAQKHDDVVLYMHCDKVGSGGGIKMEDLVKAVGIPSHKIKFVDPYMYRSGVPLEAMAAVYTATDVLLATSMGEGFGLPTVEAQACSTRVIVSDFAASAELVGDGWKVGGQPIWDAPQKAWFHVPNVEEIVAALEEAYQLGRTKSQKAADFAAAYEADAVWDKHWRPILAKY
jgi:hypothetical protein